MASRRDSPSHLAAHGIVDPPRDCFRLSAISASYASRAKDCHTMRDTVTARLDRTIAVSIALPLMARSSVQTGHIPDTCSETSLTLLGCAV